MKTKDLTFSQLRIDHETYDTIEILTRHIHYWDFCKAFYNELQFKKIERLLDLFAYPLEEILAFDGYTPKDIHGLLATAKEYDLKFGEVPEWVIYYRKNSENFQVERFLNSKVLSVEYPFSRPSLNRKEWVFLREEFGVERVYQFLRIDRKKVSEVKYMGKKIIEALDYFIDRNEIDKLKIKGTNPKKL